MVQSTNYQRRRVNRSSLMAAIILPLITIEAPASCSLLNDKTAIENPSQILYVHVNIFIEMSFLYPVMLLPYVFLIVSFSSSTAVVDPFE